jgi:RNA polymerase sigma-70 factor, ECF subfamily
LDQRRDKNEQIWLAERFDQHRGHLRAVAYRMLGSVNDADDAVQEAWLRVSGADSSRVQDLRAWLTTVVARICLNALRSRAARPEQLVDPHVPDPIVTAVDRVDPEHEAMVADSVGLALMIVLETLAPAERLAFVLHDIFDVPFDQIAAIVDRSEPAARQLASRARRRVGSATTSEMPLAAQWEVVDAFLAAGREGDFEALLKVLDPDVVRRLDVGAGGPVALLVLRGARDVAAGAIAGAAFGHVVRRVLVNGAPGVVTFAAQRPAAVFGFTVVARKITELNVLADPARVRRLDLTAAAPQATRTKREPSSAAG